MARHQLGHGSRTMVAQELEARDHRRRLRTRVGGVDSPALLGALENRDEDLEQEPLRAGHLHPGARELERGLEQHRPTRVARGARVPRRAPGRGRERRPSRRRRERPVSTRRRSRSAPRPSAPAAVTGRRRSNRAASARHRLRARGRSRRPQVLSAALRPRTPRVRRRRRRRLPSLPAPEPRRLLRRCADSRLRRLHAWWETSRAVCPGFGARR